MLAITVDTDTIDLLVTAAVLGSAPDGSPRMRGRDLASIADEYGQALLNENYASASYARGVPLQPPTYTWRPVFELFWREEPGQTLTEQQALQLEKSRLLVSENSREHPGWDGSTAQQLLEALGRAVADRLKDWPVVPSTEHAGVYEYAGLGELDGAWTRQSPLAASPTAAAGGGNVR